MGLLALKQANASGGGGGGGGTSDPTRLSKSANLSDLTNVATARTNLGLGTAALSAATDFDAADAAGAAQSAAATYTDSETTRASAAEALKLAKASNLSDLANAGTARTNLGLGTAATHPATDFESAGALTTAEAYTDAETARATTAEGTKLTKSSNLSDVTSASTARTNLGLGTAATQASSAFDAAGAASAAQAAAATYTDAETTRASAAEALKLAKASNLSDLASATTARTNLGLGTAATHPATDFESAGALTTAEAYTDTETARATAAEALKLAKASNLSDLANAGTARTNLGLGTSAVRDTGVSAFNVLMLDSGAKIPAADASQITNLPLVVPIVKTANFTVLTSQNGCTFYNTAASGEVDLTLPTAAPGLGYHAVITAAQILKFITGGSDTITWAGVTTTATHVYANQVGANIYLVCIEANKWIVFGTPLGDWSVG